MPAPPLPVQLVDARTGETFEKLRLNWTPYPGHTIQLGNNTYTILEKRHYYQLRAGRYVLDAIRAFVRPAPEAAELVPGNGDRERSLMNGQWVIGDSTCEYNARSPLLRCAPNPLGPCAGCTSFQPRSETRSE
ncbi:DUF6464 family protein [Synechococcus sp. PCC 7336]|uniref:DUF6464 family protein n=1 Tax=Synechococcus sp. PCC 7336 TaxID=195250 RepID=UPI00034999E7|nr:DUF6464 family protein [Synechococcus sp. PCC 7336]